MAWPTVRSRPADETRRRVVSSRAIQGRPATASSPMTFTGSPLRARRACRPRLPGAARHSLWLQLPAGTDCPFLKLEFARQQEPSARRLSAAEAAALRCRSVASRGGAVGVLAGASRRPTSTVANASSTAAVPSRTQLRRAHVLRDCLVCRLRIQTSCSLPWAPSRRAARPAPRPLGGPNPSPHSCRLQVSSVPSRPTRRSMRIMRWPGLPSAAYSVPRPDDETRRRTVSSRPTASFPLTLPRSPQLARWARRPRLPGTARHSLWLRLTAGTNCPFLKLEFTHQQDPSVRPSSAAAAAASGRCSVASRCAP